MAHSNSVERAVAILELLGTSRHGWHIAQIGRRLNMPKSTAHVLVSTLERLGYVQRNPGQRLWSLGLKVYALGNGLTGTLELAELARPHLLGLTESTNLTTDVAVLDRDQAICIAVSQSPDPPQFDIYPGKKANLHCTAVGKVLLAQMTEDGLNNYLSRHALGRNTHKTITVSQKLHDEVKAVRKTGYAVDDEEQELGIRCLGVPVYDQLGRPSAALAIVGTVQQIHPENYQFLSRRATATAKAVSETVRARAAKNAS